MLSYLFIGGDTRMLETYRLIEKSGASVKIAGMDRIPGCGGISFEKAAEYAADSEKIIFPVPYTRDGVSIFAPNSQYTYAVKGIISRIKGEVFYGAPSSLEQLEGVNILNNRQYAENNARLTAECTAELLESKYGRELSKCDVLICGFGKVGRSLEKALINRSASVTAAVRREKVFEDIIQAGSMPLHISRLDQSIGRFDVIINTVPERIFDLKSLDALKNDAVMIDLASYPYGLDHDKCNNKNVFLELGLPGKMRAPEEAAAIHNVITGEWEEKAIET